MTKKYFGTDGIRGRVGEMPITPEFVIHLGYSAGKVLTSADWHLSKGERPAVLIGKDTRISGYMLESALQAGLSAAGVDVLLSGPMPTPAVAYLTRALRLQAGIVISASHNPFEDNGIKFFSASGTKLPDAVETEIEAGLNAPLKAMPSAQLGKARRVNDARGRYIEFCKSTFPNHLDLRGLRIVVDCAHGATYQIAGPVFHELGADVVAIGVQPDGLNINQECGATHSSLLQEAVRHHHADIGIALLDSNEQPLLRVELPRPSSAPIDPSSLAGYGLFQNASPGVVAFVLAFAAGAILTMLADTMMPEAFEHGGKLVGVVTTLGFGLAFALTVLDGGQLGGHCGAHLLHEGCGESAVVDGGPEHGFETCHGRTRRRARARCRDPRRTRRTARTSRACGRVRPTLSR